MSQPLADNNFLVPNATFIVEFITFLLILAIIARYILPPIQKAMRERQAIIAKQMQDSDEAKQQLADAQKKYQEALNEARTESAQIRENARAEAQRTIEELRREAQEESARIVARGEEQLASQRSSIVRELRGEIGALAVELSEKIVDQRLADDASVSSTVDAFLAGLEAKRTPTRPAPARRRPGVRLDDAFGQPAGPRELREHQASVLDRASAATLTTVAEELYSVGNLLVGQPRLRRTLGDPATRRRRPRRAAGGLLQGKVSATALDSSRPRWRSAGPPRGTSPTPSRRGRRRVVRCRREGRLPGPGRGRAVPFRAHPAGRRQPPRPARRVRPPTSAGARVVDTLLEGKVRPSRWRCCTTRSPASASAASSWRSTTCSRRPRPPERSVARVISAAPLQRAAAAAREALSATYGRQISVRAALDPAARRARHARGRRGHRRQRRHPARRPSHARQLSARHSIPHDPPAPQHHPDTHHTKNRD